MLQQLTAEVQPRLAAKVNSAVSLDRTRMVNITLSHHFSRYTTKHIISHTCGTRSGRHARYLSSRTHSYFRAMSCNSSSSVFLNHYATLRTKQRRGSKASGFRKQCHEGSTTSSHVMTPLVQLQQHLHTVASCIFIFHETRILRLSETRSIPWFLTEEVEVLVDPSTT